MPESSQRAVTLASLGPPGQRPVRIPGDLAQPRPRHSSLGMLTPIEYELRAKVVEPVA